MKALSRYKVAMKKMLSMMLCACLMHSAHAQKTTITVAAYPAVDDIVKAALKEWQKKKLFQKIRLCSIISLIRLVNGTNIGKFLL